MKPVSPPVAGGHWRSACLPGRDPLSNRRGRMISAGNILARHPLMNMQEKTGTFDLNKYGVGQPVRRTEDPVLVQGQGRYTDDLDLAGQAYAVFVRSRHGHGVIKGIDTAAAKAM